MNKNVLICFRASSTLRSSLEKIAGEHRRSVSSTIENILYRFLEERRGTINPEEEKRRYPRKKIASPALVSRQGQGFETPQAAIVLDVSLGGLQISIPSTYQLEATEDKEHGRISIAFTLPAAKHALTIQCVPKHVYHSDGEITVGASFIDTDFASYQTLQNYLIN
jgi:hypothetical protein